MLSYVQQGDPAGPVVVFLPGPTDSLRSYDAVLDHLPHEVRAVAVSMRGHGDSDKPASGYRVEDFASDVVPFLDGLGVGRAVLCGHSGSCLVARRVALDHPERVAGLVLEASPTTLRANAGLEAYVRELTELEDPIDPDFARSVITDTSSEDLDPAVIDVFTAELLKVPARVWQEMFAALLQYDDLDDLGRVVAPALLVWGDADTIVPRAMQDALVSHLAGAELVVYEGVGHTPRWEVPDRFAADVARFVPRAFAAPG